MTTSPSSGLSAEAKEFVPLVQVPPTTIPLFVDENTVATIYSSDQQQQQPLISHPIYPMMVSHSKLGPSNVLQFPEIEFHIQPTQQQCFHIDSCNTVQQPPPSTNGNSPITTAGTPTTSQIILLPTTAATGGYFPGGQILYSNTEQPPAFYPVDYCEPPLHQPLISFSVQQQQPAGQMSKSNRISSSYSQQPRYNNIPASSSASFRHQRGTNTASYRASSRGTGRGMNRNSYYEQQQQESNNTYQRPSSFNSRRNGPPYNGPYSQSPGGRGNSGKRIASSSYHQPEDNNYHHYPPSATNRPRGLLSRSSQQHDEQRRDLSTMGDYHNNVGEIDHHQHHHQTNEMMMDDETSFEFRPEDFPSLPMNPVTVKQSDKLPQSLIPRPNSISSSWNTIVSTTRPHSTSPRSPVQSQQQQQQSGRSRSSNKKPSSSSDNQKSFTTNNINKKKSTTKSPNRASKSIVSSGQQQQPQRSRSVTSADETKSNHSQEDGFIQIKHQRRIKRRKSKTKEEQPPVVAPTTSIESSSTSSKIVESTAAPFALDDDNAFPVLGQQVSTSKKSENDSTIHENAPTSGMIRKPNPKTNTTYEVCLTDMFNALSTSTQVKQQPQNPRPNTSSTMNTATGANPLDSRPAPKRGKEREQPKQRKPTKLKRIINKELEENQKQRQQSSLVNKTTTNKSNDDEQQQQIEDETDTNTADGADRPVTVVHVTENECTSASCTQSSDDDDDDDDDDGDEPTSQLPTPFCIQHPSLLNQTTDKQLHDAGFREYCAQLIDRQLDEVCIQLLLTLKRFQDRKKQQFVSNPERARAKRRFVHGIREVTKHLRLQRLKCILIAPDCQSIQTEGGLNEAIDRILNLCKEQSIPFVFTLNRQKLGRCLNKISRISTIGIFDYSGADGLYKKMIDITDENQRAYKQIVDNILNHQQEEQQQQQNTVPPSHGLNSREFYKILHRTFQQQQQTTTGKKTHQQYVNSIPNESLSKVLPKVPAHYAHSRQTSDTSTIYIDPQLISSMNAAAAKKHKQHVRASSGTFEITKPTGGHQRTLSAGATIDLGIIPPTPTTTTTAKGHSRTPSGCSAISQVEQQDYFEQSKTVLMQSTVEPSSSSTVEMPPDATSDELRLKSIHEDTEESSAHTKRKHVEKWINDN